MSERQTEIIQRAADLMIGALNEYRQDAPTAEKVCAQMNALHAAGLTITPQAGAEPVKCQHCNGTGEIEPDNNGPIGPCPMCNGKGSYIPRTAPPRPVCDGNHAAPACADPECWQRPSQVAPVWQPTHRHYKGGEYQLLYIAHMEDTGRTVAVYKDHNGLDWVRPYSEFQQKFTALPSPPDSPGAEES